MASSDRSGPSVRPGDRALVLSNRLDDLPFLNAWMEQLGAELELFGEALADLKVCAYEAVANVILYAFEDGGHHAIHLRCRETADGVALTIEDDGRAFNPLAVAPPPPPDSVAVATIGGHGIRIIQRHADALSYVREDGCNRLTIEKKRP